jgi:putative two-component system response regulator
MGMLLDESAIPGVQLPQCSFDEAAAAQMEKFVADIGRMYRERNEALKAVTRAHHEALLRLALAAEVKDDDTGVHIVRIGVLAEALALRLGESTSFARMLRHGAPMHDIGKIGIPDSVLKKPGALTPEERAVMNGHAQLGAEILGRSQIPLFQLAAEIAMTHHERYDGTGYPRRLAGSEIPLSGRITAVVDFYDALTMDRVYRPAFSVEKALQMLQGQRAAAFDPHVVDTFVAHAGELESVRLQANSQMTTFEALLNSV